MNNILIDSSFLFALNEPKDSNHQRAKAFTEHNNSTYLIPDVVLTESSFLANRAGGVPAVLRFLDRLVTAQPTLQPLTLPDIANARRIMATYPDARLDFVDCCIMALSERLDITQVCTFDRRDFSIFRPQHCDYLDLLP